MSTTQAKIAQRKLTEESGIPDSLADQMFNLQSGHWVAIVDLAHLDRTEGREEKHVVRLEIGQLEIMTGDSADHCRELMRAAYLSRQPRGLDQVDQQEEDTDEIIARGRRKLKYCDTCLHERADQRISHAPDPEADGAECKWKDTNEPVTPGEDDESLDDQVERVVDEVVSGSATTDEAPDSIDQPWPGDPDYTQPPADDQEPATVGADT